MKRNMTVTYSAIQLFYIMIYSGFGRFISAFLLPMGYSSTDIGLILSSANLASLALQLFGQRQPAGKTAARFIRSSWL